MGVGVVSVGGMGGGVVVGCWGRVLRLGGLLERWGWRVGVVGGGGGRGGGGRGGFES